VIVCHDDPEQYEALRDQGSTWRRVDRGTAAGQACRAEKVGYLLRKLEERAGPNELRPGGDAGR